MFFQKMREEIALALNYGRLTSSSILNVTANLMETNKRIKALEEYHNITFFEGPKTKAHYKAKRVEPKKPVGRPQKIIN